MNEHLKKTRLVGHLLALAAILVWGSTFISSKVLLSVYSPPQLITMRFAVAYAALWLIRPRAPRIVWRDEAQFFLLGCFGGSVYSMLENTALTRTLASNVSIIVSAAPILTAVLAHFFTSEKLRSSALWGFLIAFAGVALVVFNGTVILKLSPVGDLLSLGAALSWAVYSVLLTRLISRYDSVVLTRKVMFYGLITALPIMLLSGPLPDLAPLADPARLFNLLFLGLFGSGVCYIAWNIATRRLGIVTTNNYIYVTPFVTMVTAAVFLREPVSVMGVAGAALIVLGVFVCNRGVRPSEPQPAEAPRA